MERPTEANKPTERYIFCTIFISLLWGSVFVDFFLKCSLFVIMVWLYLHRKKFTLKEPTAKRAKKSSKNLDKLKCPPTAFFIFM